MSSRLHGWRGRVLHVDLGTGLTRIEEPEHDELHRFLGGRGLAGRYLARHADLPQRDPGQPLVFMSGPLVSTIAPTSGRGTFMARSPLTGAVGDSSVGGALATRVKRAGLDGFVVTGRAKNPVGLIIDEDEARIVDASGLAGLPADEIAAHLPHGCSTAIAGPAAFSGCAFASIVVDGRHAAGRTGIGLVMADRNLVYIAARGTRRTSVADMDRLKRAREEIFRLCAASPALMGEHGFTCFGTGALYDLMDARLMMPTDNFRETRFGFARELNAPAFRERYQPESAGCVGCHIKCKKTARDGRTLPEFETMSHFSALIANTDMELVMRAGDVCNRLGMDTISAAATLACHQEIEGVRLSPDDVIALLEDMGRGRGLGAELAAGSRAYAEKRGRPEASMSVKSLELPAYDPRGAYGMALALAVATRGGDHLRAYPVSHEILRKPVATDRFSFAGKARIIKIAEDQNAVVDSLTACKFPFFSATLEEYAEACAAVTGIETNAHDLLAAGERIVYAERILNAGWGFDASHDDLPARFFEEDGASAQGIQITRIDRDAFLDARARYYRVRGLDENGRPTPETAKRLGLE